MFPCWCPAHAIASPTLLDGLSTSDYLLTHDSCVKEGMCYSFTISLRLTEAITYTIRKYVATKNKQ